MAPFWGSAKLPEKVSHDMGYHSDSIAISRDLGASKGEDYGKMCQKSFVGDLGQIEIYPLQKWSLEMP